MGLLSRVLGRPKTSNPAHQNSAGPPPPQSSSPSVEIRSRAPFLYQGLSPGAIRLITILPGAGNEPIRCFLSTNLLASVAGRYEALSYTWGSEVDKASIYPDNGVSHLLVTRNCEAAIHRLRLSDQIRVLWIDAVCINQADILERNEQVSMMANIYKCASQVLIYLGESGGASDQAMRVLSRIENHELAYNETLSSEDHQALQALLRRPWFTRVWVLQEVYMSRKAVIFCGGYAVSWNSIQILRGFDRLASISLGRWPYATTIKDRARFAAQTHLLHLLMETRDCQAADPRDKLFALLSMFPDAAKYQLRADYSLAFVHVLQRVAMHLARYQGLQFLSAIQGRSRVPELPSWVPDWTTPLIRGSLYPQIRKNASQFEAGPSWMEARGVQRPVWELNDLFNKRFPQESENSLARHLHVFGYGLGKINLLLETIDLENMQWTDVLDYCNQVARSVPQNSSLQAAQARLAMSSSGSHVVLTEARNDLLRFMIDEMGHPRRVELLSVSEELNLYDTDVIDPGTKNLHLLWTECVKDVMNGRRFFATTDGFVGFAPSEAEMGDITYILASGPVPYLFRQTHCNHIEPPSAIAEQALTYSFVGESYVAGVMNCNNFMHYVWKQVSYTDLILC